jgi:hypothetical protein
LAVGGGPMRRLAFLLLMSSTLFAQVTRPLPLGIGGDRLFESTAEYKANSPKCFMPMESLPTNYKVWRYRKDGDNRFDCRITSSEKEQPLLLGFSLMVKQTVIADDHVAAIFYNFRRADFSEIEGKLRIRLGHPTVEKIDGYSGRDGCKGKEIHWTNDVSDIVLINHCEEDEFGATALNLFYTRRANFETKPSE